MCITFIGIIILALIAKYVEHWRYIQLAINIPTLATLLYIWYILRYLDIIIVIGSM